MVAQAEVDALKVRLCVCITMWRLPPNASLQEQLRTKDEALSAAQEQLRVKDEALSAAQEQLRTKDEALSAAQHAASEAASERDSLAQQLKEAKEGLTKQAAVTPSQVEVTLFRAT